MSAGPDEKPMSAYERHCVTVCGGCAKGLQRFDLGPAHHWIPNESGGCDEATCTAPSAISFAESEHAARVAAEALLEEVRKFGVVIEQYEGKTGPVVMVSAPMSEELNGAMERIAQLGDQRDELLACLKAVEPYLLAGDTELHELVRKTIEKSEIANA